MHFLADMFAIPQAVLNEWNFIARQQIKITTTTASDFFNCLAVTAHIAAMPENGSERVGIANQNTVRLSGGGILATRLFFRNRGELLGAPIRIILRELYLRIFAPVFPHPRRLKMFGQCICE